MEVERDGWIIPKNQTTNFKVLGLSPVLVLSAYHGKKKNKDQLENTISLHHKP